MQIHGKMKRGVGGIMPGLDMNDILDEDIGFKRAPSSPFQLGSMLTIYYKCPAF